MPEVVHGAVDMVLDDDVGIYSCRAHLGTLHVHDPATLAVTTTIEHGEVDTFGRKVLAVNGVVYTVSPADRRVSCIDTRAARPRLVRLAYESDGAPTADGDRLLLTPREELVALDLATHARRWSIARPSAGFVAAPNVAAGIVVVASERVISAFACS